MNGCILVPVKGFRKALGKTRLAESFRPAERAILVESMAERVVRTASEVAPVYLLAREDPPPKVAAHVYDTLVDLGRGLNAELEAAIDTLLANEHDRLLVLPGDIPLVTTSVLECALHQLDDHDVVVAPATDGGTALLGIRSPRRSRMLFGERSSCRAHAENAQDHGLSVFVLDSEGPLLDVDTADDVVLVQDELSTTERCR
ncbi:MAG: 2-phospho-L-lactate guanylyltransferase [Candidatus Undinarchaeales archaeon]|nr:2-phospho-L-lactate guanylyltransferase [Candidatus Undinarchaeales archaeon]MDP7491741.1 2-phospho-L-lactate guanylyltransferase [Candidatus Undinarchaeales archaeon]